MPGSAVVRLVGSPGSVEVRQVDLRVRCHVVRHIWVVALVCGLCSCASVRVRVRVWVRVRTSPKSSGRVVDKK